MTQTSSGNKRILSNTIYLYLRMLITMGVSLYTSRVILDVLGVDDYGIYNVIGGIIVLVSIINHSMSSATQRFITYELGKGNLKQVSDTFSMSMTIHIFIAVFILVLGELFGVYYVVNYLNVAPDRVDAALWVFHISLITLFFNIIRVPYNASIIAYERMGFFAVISMAEVLLQLLIVYLLIIIDYDKLVLYALFVMIVTSLITFMYKIYCNRMFKTCHYYFYIDKVYFKNLISFVGWNFVGAIATTGTNQVGNILINYYCGPSINAAYGLANRVNASITGFANNFQTAYTPQITKLYAQNNNEQLFLLMNRSALMSYYLLFIIAAPLCFYVDYVLNVWLIDVPKYTGLFIIFLILYNLIDSLQAPLWKVITATGNIKVYEIWLNVLLFFNIPLSFWFLKNGYSPYVVVIISVLLNLVTAIVRTIHVKIQIGFPVRKYIYNVVIRGLNVSILYLLPAYILSNHLVIDSIFDFILFYLISLLYISCLIISFGLNSNDRRLLYSLILNKFRISH